MAGDKHATVTGMHVWLEKKGQQQKANINFNRLSSFE